MGKSEKASEQTETAVAEDGVAVQEVELPEADDTAVGAASGKIDILLDATLSVEVHLGRVEAQVRELLRLGPGSVLRLDKQVGEPMDLYLRGVRFATGRLVVVGDRLGVTIKEIISPGSVAPAGEPA